jgi:hypothetical protein
VAVERAGDTEFGLDSHDPTLHPIERTGYAGTPTRDTAIRPIPEISMPDLRFVEIDVTQEEFEKAPA